MTDRYRRVLEMITRVGGVRGAMLITADDGLVIADAVMEDVRAAAVAALAANLMKRFGRVAVASGAGAPQFLHLQGEGGTLVVVPAPESVLVVAIGDRDMNVGLARLAMLRAAEGLA